MANSRGKQIKQSTCPYCGVGCGIEVSVDNSVDNSMGNSAEKYPEINMESSAIPTRLVDLLGDSQHPANFGRLCIKGQSLLETNQIEGRLTHPHILGDKHTWPETTTWVANKLADTIAKYGKNSVAFYVSGQLLTEDYYLANKLMKGFIGSANIDTNSRLCMSSAVAAYTRAFGEDLVPCCYEDLDITELIVLIGSNAAWTHPVLFQRMERAKRLNSRLRIVQIDPRKTASSSIVDKHLPILPGSDAILFNGLLRYINIHGIDLEFVHNHTDGFDAAINASEQYTPQAVAHACGIGPEDVIAFFEMFVSSPSAISFYSMGINQSTSGVDKANAIINCHLASGKIGKQGSGPFSITGQPNAMGGREVGGLANMLAAHMSLDNPSHRHLVSEFWQTNSLASSAGYKAVDLFDAIYTGAVKFIWIMGTNPVASMPNRGRIEAALAKCETVVVSDVVKSNDTLRFAHAVLPATPWSEKNGTVTNSERCISRQRSLLAPLGQARHDWQIIAEVATKMGFGHAFSYTSVDQIFTEHASLSAYKNNGERAFNLGALSTLSAQQYDELKPVQWPLTQPNGSGFYGQKRLFEDKQFFTPNKRARFVAITPRAPEQQTSSEYPFVLNSGRMRDHWHTMTRTANASRLHQHSQVAYLHMHPKNAQALSLISGDLVEVSAKANVNGRVILPLKLDQGLRVNTLFAPIHWTNEWSSNASIAWLFSSANDPLSGQPELKHGAVNVQKAAMLQHAVIASRVVLSKQQLAHMADYWTCVKLTQSYVYRLAIGTGDTNCVDGLTQAYVSNSVKYQYASSNAATQTIAHFVNDTLSMLVHIADSPPQCETTWLDSLFDKSSGLAELSHILRFAAPASFLLGKVICSCHQVRELPINEAIDSGINTLDALGKYLKCGTQCGSCKSEVAAMIEAKGVNRRLTDVDAKQSIAPKQGMPVAQNEHLIPITNVERVNYE